MAPHIGFEPVIPGDADALVALRIAAMRESLERIGRFDPQRARDRFLAGFDAQATRHIVAEGVRVGLVVVRPSARDWLLDHLYVRPESQGLGIGAAVLDSVVADSNAARMPLRACVLRESDANRFYQRHGFVLTQQAQWDNHYLRPCDRL